MYSIGCVIDFDGFFIDKTFVVKELGVAYCTSNRLERYTFQVGDFKTLSPKDKKTATYTMRNIHGMKFTDKDRDLPQIMIGNILQKIYKKILAENKQYIAYKGGSVEKKLLEAGNIKSFNLEDIGCPKFNELFTGETYKINCTLHNYINTNKIAHCAVLEVFYFKNWYMKFLKSKI